MEFETLGLPSDLSQPLVLPEGVELPEEGAAAADGYASPADPGAPGAAELEGAEPAEAPLDSAVGPTGQITTGAPLPGAPPPPRLPQP